MPLDGGRARLVAEADACAVRASGLEGEAAAREYERAAELREQSYLEFGKAADALEAKELWLEADAAHQDSSCERALRHLGLEQTLEPSPRAYYERLYVLREGRGGLECRSRVERALGVLASVAPTDDVLRQLRAGVERAGPKSGAVGSHQDNPNVVVPELEKSLEQPTKITRVEPFGAEEAARVVVHVTHPTRFEVGVVEPGANRGPRLFVDVRHASFEGTTTFEAGGLVERVRLGKQEGGTRIVLDLARVAHHRVFYLPDPFRLVIDVSVRSPDELREPRALRRVVLDPGHGGEDPGAVGPNGLREKDVTLDIAHRAAPLLAREAGVSTLLTRDVDAYVPLDVRAAKANAFHADLFISIHFNSSEDSGARGVMTFVLDSSRDVSAARVAARENASTEAAAAELANALSQLSSEDRRRASELFARLLQRGAGSSLRQAYSDIEDHGVRRAGFYVLAGATMPAVLFEGSFISNPVEADRLDSEDYRRRLADGIVNAVRAYKQGLSSDAPAD